MGFTSPHYVSHPAPRAMMTPRVPATDQIDRDAVRERRRRAREDEDTTEVVAIVVSDKEKIAASCAASSRTATTTARRVKEIVEKLLTGLRRLEYRGYDSAGLAIDDGSDASHTEAKVFRQTGKIANLEALLRESEGLSRGCV